MAQISNSLSKIGHDTFSSLQVRNYRLYYMGQIISTSGTFMQSIAQAWLVLQITGSGTALGIVSALQFLPVLILSPFGGVVADRFSKRKLLIVTQSSFGVLALVLGALVATGLVRLWMIEVLAFLYGLVNVFDNPTRQSFVVEMVGEADLRNAVTLYSSLVNLSRVIGPTLAARVIAAVGLAPCFILNGISYAAVLIMLLRMVTSELRPAPRARGGAGQLSAGFRYVLSTPVLRVVLIMLAIVGTLTFEFQVSLPLLAQFTFHGDASSYAALTSAMGIGAVVGGLITAGQKKTTAQLLVIAAFAFGFTTLLAGFTPNLIVAIVVMLFVGFASIYFTALANSLLQLQSAPQMRGRVMSFWAIAFLGSTTIGAPIIGWVGEVLGPRWGLGIGGAAGIIAAVIGMVALRNVRARPAADETVKRTAESVAEQDIRVQ